jgi:hypothetical protein
MLEYLLPYGGDRAVALGEFNMRTGAWVQISEVCNSRPSSETRREYE